MFCTLSMRLLQIIMPEDALRQIEIRLSEAEVLFKRRLDWLTSGSRRLCGVLSDRRVCLVVDLQSSDRQQFELFIDVVACLLQEQVSQLSLFNILWY